MIHEHEWAAYLERLKEMAVEAAFIAEALKDDNDPEHLLHSSRAEEIFELIEELQDATWEVQWFTDTDDSSK